MWTPAPRDCCTNLKPLTWATISLSLARSLTLNQMCINYNNWKWTLKSNKQLLLRFIGLFCALGNRDIDAGSTLHSSCEARFVCDDVKKFPERLCALEHCLVLLSSPFCRFSCSHYWAFCFGSCFIFTLWYVCFLPNNKFLFTFSIS